MPTAQLTATHFGIVPRWILRHPNLKSTSKLVYAGLRDRANEQKNAWPGQRCLSRDLGISVPTVNAAIAELEAVGALTVTRRDGKVNRYHMNHDEPTVQESLTGVQNSETVTVQESLTEEDPSSKKTQEGEPSVAVKPQKPEDPYWENTSAILGEPPKSKESLQGRFIKMVKASGAPPEEITIRAERLVAQWGPKALTLPSLEDHWNRFGAPAGQITDTQVNDSKRRNELLNWQDHLDPDAGRFPAHVEEELVRRGKR